MYISQTAVHMCVLYNNQNDTWKILTFTPFWHEDPPPEVTFNSVLVDLHYEGEDPLGTYTIQEIPDWPGSNNPAPMLFCAGHNFLPDGRLIVAGGNLPPINANGARGLRYTYSYDPVTEEWGFFGNPNDPVQMANGRWYPTLTLLSNGKILAIDGFGSEYEPGTEIPEKNEIPEIFDPENPEWVQLPDAENWIDNYPGGILIPFDNGNIKKGEVFFCMPVQTALRLNADGNGAPNAYWNDVSQSSQVRINGAAVLQPLKWNETKAVVHLIGGTTGSENEPTGLIEKIDLNTQGTPAWGSGGALVIPRKNANCVNLPDGKILITGGNQFGERETFVSAPEMYDPETGLTDLMAAMSYPRWYHSTAILLPDATVLASGGDNHAGYPNTNTFEVYKPGYLFDGDRPVITYIETQNLSYGQEFNINCSHQIAEAIIIKPGFPTHGFDQSQRAIYLETAAGEPNGNFPYVLTVPANSFIAPPGYFMLFVLRPKSASNSGQNKIPSVAKFIKISLD